MIGGTETDYRQQVTIQRIRIASFTVGFAIATLLVTYVTSVNADEVHPVLKEQIEVYSDIVTLGDLFDNAGNAANRAVFRSPDLGEEGTIRSSRVAAAASREGLYWPNPGQIQSIMVRRPSRLITLEEIEKSVRVRLATEPAVEKAGSLKIILNPGSESMHVDPRSSEPVIVKQFDFNSRSGNLRAVIGLQNAEDPAHDRIYRGRAMASMEVAVPVRSIDRGQTISAEDLKLTLIPKSRMRKGFALNKEQITGMAAKRRFTEGRPILLSDLEQPKMVRNNSLVAIVFETPGLLLKSEGRALADGSQGDTISVLNTQSKRTIQATIIGPGVVTVNRSSNFTNRQGSSNSRKYSNRTSLLVR